ncbi:MAG: PAS domain S-box protein [Desulfobacterales bacterium]|nr:PAS domain S-box protein [Desulfobacterales bacterium]
MLKTIRSKMLFLVAALIMMTAIALVFATSKIFKKETTNLHSRLAREALQSAMLLIDADYNELVSYEVGIVTRRRDLMKNMSAGIRAMIDAEYDLFQSGVLTEQSARNRALNRIKNFRYGTEQYFFVFDPGLTGLAHPREEMIGVKWTGFMDVKQKDALELMRDVAVKEDMGYTVFQWPRLHDASQVKQMGFFFYYPRWKWIIGTSMEVDDIKKDSEERLNGVRVKLGKMFSRMNLIDTGQIFIFNDKGKILIQPLIPAAPESHRTRRDLDAGALEKLMEAAHDPEKPVEHAGGLSPDLYRPQIAYVNYFKPMGWYVAASVYKDAISRPVGRLAVGQIRILLVVLLAGIVIAIFISHKISRPLTMLAHYAKELPAKDLAAEKDRSADPFLTIALTGEVKQLADSFLFMETQLRKNIRELKKHRDHLEELVDERTIELRGANQDLKREIAERVQAEEALRESEGRRRAILEAVPYIITISRVEDGRLLNVNNVFCRISGYTREESIGKSIFDLRLLVEPEKRATFFNILKKKGELNAYEIKYRKKDGTIMDTLISLRPLRYNGENCVVAVVTDITERKRTEEELRNFVYIIAHDMKTPLRGISSLATWLSDDYHDVLDEQGREHLKKLLIRTKRMHYLIEGTLQYLHVGRETPEPRRMESEVVVRRVIDSLSPPENIDIRIETPLPVVFYDSTHLEQLFGGLLANAIQHLNKPAGEIVVSCASRRSAWEFCVTDNGVGIEEKHFKRIFKIFQSLKPRPEGKSIGVGLSLVKKIVEHNNGKVRVESTIGRGSSFFFTIAKHPDQDAES